MEAHIIIVLGAATLITAFVAAWCWYQASIVPMQEFDRPKASVSASPAIHILRTDVSLIHVSVAVKESSRLNKRAAIWTGISALLSGVTTFAGLFH